VARERTVITRAADPTATAEVSPVDSRRRRLGGQMIERRTAKVSRSHACIAANSRLSAHALLLALAESHKRIAMCGNLAMAFL